MQYALLVQRRSSVWWAHKLDRRGSLICVKGRNAIWQPQPPPLSKKINLNSYSPSKADFGRTNMNIKKWEHSHALCYFVLATWRTLVWSLENTCLELFEEAKISINIRSSKFSHISQPLSLFLLNSIQRDRNDGPPSTLFTTDYCHCINQVVQYLQCYFACLSFHHGYLNNFAWCESAVFINKLVMTLMTSPAQDRSTCIRDNLASFLPS